MGRNCPSLDNQHMIVGLVVVGRRVGCMMMRRREVHSERALCSLDCCRCSCPSLDCLGRRSCGFGFGSGFGRRCGLGFVDRMMMKSKPYCGRLAECGLRLRLRVGRV